MLLVTFSYEYHKVFISSPDVEKYNKFFFVEKMRKLISFVIYEEIYNDFYILSKADFMQISFIFKQLHNW